MRRFFLFSEYSGTAAIRMAAEYVIITSEKTPCGARDHSNCLEPTPDLSEASSGSAEAALYVAKAQSQ